MDTSSLSRAHDPIDPRYAHAEDLVALLDELAAACPERAEWIAMWRARITSRSAKILELTARNVELHGAVSLIDLVADAAGVGEDPSVLASRAETSRLLADQAAQRRADDLELARGRRAACTATRELIARSRARRWIPVRPIRVRVARHVRCRRHAGVIRVGSRAMPRAAGDPDDEGAQPLAQLAAGGAL